MSASITTDYEGFKRLASEFLQAAPTLDLAGLDNGHKCLNLAYLGCEFGNGPFAETNRMAGAPAIMRLATKAYLARELELEQAAAAL
ncbi:hypothetical protein ABIC83_002901 [Roseateles asaccharophilus]|uniref:hypothetical protein n=1 Tax=Roseateles asaccharophilus TaxID=582607 RepID=UPI0038394FF2